jgi:hypothetical protein
MKKLLSLTLVAVMTLHAFTWMAVSVSAQQIVQEKLTNKDVIEMNKAGMSEAIILAKIKTAETNFDTSTAELQELKAAGLSDAVILAMVESGKKVEVQTVAVETAAPVEILIPDGTEIEIELKNNLSGEEAKMGETIDFTVVRPVEVNGIKIIEQGASAKGKITKAKKAGRWGRTGKLEWAMSDVLTVSGTRIPVRFTKSMQGGSKGGTVAVAAVATTVLLGPVGLLWGLKKGKKAEIPAGNKYSIFADGDSKIKLIPIKL